jgi:teichuronic acid biosynthesis glycosyltransferase TuaC
MRICLYTNTAFPCMGGQEMVVDELARQYQHLGHDVVVLCPDPPRSLVAADDKLPYQVVRHPRYVSTRWFVDWHELSLKRLHREFKYDIIHCHNVYPNGYLAVRHHQRGGPPVVITSHGGDVRIDNPRFSKPGLIERHRLAVQSAQALVSISHFTDQGFLRLGARPDALRNISNGVHVHAYAEPVDRPATVPAHIQKQQFHLCIGRLAYRKGVDVLLRAAALQSQSPEQGAKLLPVVICGDGQERASLEQLSHQLGLDQRVIFMGNVVGDAKRWLLQNALSLVIPTREWEAFPMVLLEGFASGCTVVASDAPGLDGLVAHGQNGWVVPRNNPKALKDRLTQLELESASSKALGTAGQLVARQHDWLHIAERHLELFEELTHQRQFPLRIAA